MRRSEDSLETAPYLTQSVFSAFASAPGDRSGLRAPRPQRVTERASAPSRPARAAAPCAVSAAMERYARGEDRAFEELYSLLSPGLHRMCIYLSGRADAEELLQEVFLKMHRARDTFVPGGSAVAWAFAIARTTCLDRLRRRRRRPEDAVPQDQLEAHAAAPSGCPDSMSTARACETALEAGLALLSECLRSAYVLVKLEGLSCSEAASVLGASPSAVKQRVHRASEELKLHLREAGW
jgi:RNA polymerase sigma-70 factor (ECF subfamily)